MSRSQFPMSVVPAGPCPAAALPDELLCSVFSFLPASTLLCAVARVCLEWNHLVPDPRVWVSSVLRYPSLSEERFQKWARASLGELTTKVDCGSCAKLTDVALGLVSELCPNLRELDFSHCAVTDEGLGHVAKQLHTLVSLRLRSCRQISDAGVQQVACGCCQLECLDLDDCPRLSDESLRAIAAHCPTLVQLRVSHCGELITDFGLEALAHGVGCRRLRLLDLEECSSVTDLGLRHLAQGCPALLNLNLNWCPHVSKEAVAALDDTMIINWRS